MTHPFHYHGEALPAGQDAARQIQAAPLFVNGNQAVQFRADPFRSARHESDGRGAAF